MESYEEIMSTLAVGQNVFKLYALTSYRPGTSIPFDFTEEFGRASMSKVKLFAYEPENSPPQWEMLRVFYESTLAVAPEYYLRYQ